MQNVCRRKLGMQTKSGLDVYNYSETIGYQVRLDQKVGKN